MSISSLGYPSDRWESLDGADPAETGRAYRWCRSRRMLFRRTCIPDEPIQYHAVTLRQIRELCPLGKTEHDRLPWEEASNVFVTDLVRAATHAMELMRVDLLAEAGMQWDSGAMAALLLSSNELVGAMDKLRDYLGGKPPEVANQNNGGDCWSRLLLARVSAGRFQPPDPYEIIGFIDQHPEKDTGIGYAVVAKREEDGTTLYRAWDGAVLTEMPSDRASWINVMFESVPNSIESPDAV